MSRAFACPRGQALGPRNTGMCADGKVKRASEATKGAPPNQKDWLMHTATETTLCMKFEKPLTSTEATATAMPLIIN